MRDGTCVPSPEAWPVDRFVVDANVPGHYGGTGQLADWDAASGLAKDHRVMLSGGLSAETVADGIGKVGPLGVDVSSGVESSPGRKDRDKIRAFITAAKAATLEE
jgi:phosphoribosylanthranilate isomerase